MAIPKIPPILTEAEWNKNKGTFAKMAGETGIGRLMAAVKLFYDEVKWSAFDVRQALRPTDTAAQIDGQLKLAEAEYQKVTPLVKKLKELEVQAALTQQKFSKNKLIPKASTDYVGKVAAAAKMFSGQVQMVKGEYDAFKKAAESKKAALPSVAAPKKF